MGDKWRTHHKGLDIQLPWTTSPPPSLITSDGHCDGSSDQYSVVLIVVMTTVLYRLQDKLLLYIPHSTMMLKAAEDQYEILGDTELNNLLWI